MSNPLSALFIDCDSFFASVEQHLDPKLRGKPIGIAPVMAETSCCIAASYEAKAYGVKTGTGIREARQLCPDICIIEAKPSEYVKIHHQVIAAVEDCIHVEKVLSIDEMWAWLPLNWRDPDFVHELGQKIKKAVTNQISPAVKVSVGAGPNKYIAKLASKMRKPNGLFIIEDSKLPEILYELELSDFHGIGRSMEMRLRASGIQTAAQLCAAPRESLRSVWGSVLGDRLWFLLRGVDIPDVTTATKSLGHSHVLPPELRSAPQAWPVLCKLLHKASERLRSQGMLTSSLSMQISFLNGPAFSPEIRFPETDCTIKLIRLLDRLWRERPEPRAQLLKVGVVLARLVEKTNYTPELFQNVGVNPISDEKHKRLDAAIDHLRARFGRDVVYLGAIQNHRKSAPMRISFTHIPDLILEDDKTNKSHRLPDTKNPPNAK